MVNTSGKTSGKPQGRNRNGLGVALGECATVPWRNVDARRQAPLLVRVQPGETGNWFGGVVRTRGTSATSTDVVLPSA